MNHAHTRLIVGLLLVLGAGRPLLAQRGYSTASVAMNRANGVVSPAQVVVEEYVNYPTHRIPLPVAPAEAALSLTWGNPSAAPTDSLAVLQVGVATAPLADFSQRRPANVCVVVDRSGSMAAEQRLEKVKAALRAFGRGLQPGDWVSIVAYDDAVTVPLPAQRADPAAFEAAVSGLQPGGSTNLHAGMVAGYEQVLRHFDPAYANRVILLTDGLANAGETNSEHIVTQSMAFNARGIDISTVGVGSDVNFELLRQLARGGRGLNHFVGADPEDLRKVFDQELESLLAVVGRRARLELRYPAGLQLLGVVGYEPELSPGRIGLPLNNLNAGLTQVVLLRFRVARGAAAALPVQATLRYEAAGTGRPVELTQAAGLRVEGRRSPAGNPLLDAEVRKNYFTGYLASALKELAAQAERGEAARALATGEAALRTFDAAYPAPKDEDLRRVRGIVARNLDLLRGESSARAPR